MSGTTRGGTWRGRLAVMAMLLAGLLLLAPAPHPAAAETPVDVELVLAVDVSWSMDFDEQLLQRDGYVAAFRDPGVIAAIRNGLHGRIAVTYVEWAGTGLQTVIAPWTVIESEADGQRFAAMLEDVVPGKMSRTSISGAIIAGEAMFEGNGFAGQRRVIDVSGDGPNNQGDPVILARDAAVERGVTINGLPLILKEPDLQYSIRELDLYYEDCVIGGPAAFQITVRDPAEFADAIRRKLILEIAGREPKVHKASMSVRAREPRVDCMIGERLWRARQIP